MATKQRSSANRNRAPAGVDQAAAFTRLLAGFKVSVTPSPDRRSSGSRGQPGEGRQRQARGGGPWDAALLDELCQFPLGAHDDQVDALSLAFHTLATAARTVPRDLPVM